MKKAIIAQGVLISLFITQTAYADVTGVAQITTFIQSVVKVMTTVAALVAMMFFVVGGYHYITSTGNPMKLDKAKTTIIYSAIGLVVCLAAFVISQGVNDLGTQAFGGVK